MPQPAEPGKRPRRDENVTASTEATDELGRGMRAKPKRTLFGDDAAAKDSAAGAGAKAPAKPRKAVKTAAMRQDAKAASSKKAMQQDAPIAPASAPAPALAPSAEEELSQAVLTSSHLALPLPGGG